MKTKDSPPKSAFKGNKAKGRIGAGNQHVNGAMVKDSKFLFRRLFLHSMIKGGGSEKKNYGAAVDSEADNFQAVAKTHRWDN